MPVQLAWEPQFENHRLTSLAGVGAMREPLGAMDAEGLSQDCPGAPTFFPCCFGSRCCLAQVPVRPR